MKHTKYTSFLCATLLLCTPAAHGVQIIEGIVAFLCAYTPIVTIGTLMKAKKTTPPTYTSESPEFQRAVAAAVATQLQNPGTLSSQEIKAVIEKIVADELKKKRDESQPGTIHATPRPNSGISKPQLVTGQLPTKSEPTTDLSKSTKSLISDDHQHHPTACTCCHRRNDAQS